MIPLAAAALVALGADPFEIQVYDGSANAPLRPGLEVHANVRPSHTLRLTFEPSLGITRFWELGAYVETSLEDGYRFEGVKLRSKLVAPSSVDPRWRFGLNLEVSYERAQWGAEVRPIIAFEDPRWLFALNPIVSFGPDGAALEPAALAVVKLPLASVGFEYYGSWSTTAPEHYVYEVANLLAVDGLELSVGVGEGLTAASARWVVKTIVGVAWP